MKRQLISLMIILPLLSLFSSLEVYAQDGVPILAPEPTPSKLKPGPRTTPKNKRPSSLSPTEYLDRYRVVYDDYRYSRITVDDTVSKFEALVKLAPEENTRAITNQFLGLLYLHGRSDPVKAEAAMEQAIKNKGSAIIQISFDNKWREMKSRSGNYGFEDNSLGWIKIESGKLTFTDRANNLLKNDKIEASLTGQQIKDLSKTVVAAFTLIEITTNNTKRPYIFAAGDMKQVETDLVIRLIQKYVMGKATAQRKATTQGKATAQVRR